jgi:hypothetical protein
MIDWYVWAPTEAIAKAVVAQSGRKLLDEENNWILAGPGHALDPGILIASRDDPETLEPGWFANLRITNGEDISELLHAAEAYGVTVKHPVTPHRVWA